MNSLKEDCVFVGPTFGGYWIPISEVVPLEIIDDPRGLDIRRMSFYYKDKKWESAIAKK